MQVSGSVDILKSIFSYRRQTQEGDSWRDGLIESDNAAAASHLKNLSNHLSVEEKERLTAAIHGYLLGKKEGTSGESIKKVDFLSDPVGGSKALGKMETVPGAQGKKINVWDKVNKVNFNHPKGFCIYFGAEFQSDPTISLGTNTHKYPPIFLPSYNLASLLHITEIILYTQGEHLCTASTMYAHENQLRIFCSF